MSILEKKVTQDMTDIDGNKSDGEGIDDTQDSQDTEFIINIKDYGYEISDPRHFGIYDDDSEEEVEEVDGVEDEEDEYDDEYMASSGSDLAEFSGEDSDYDQNSDDNDYDENVDEDSEWLG